MAVTTKSSSIINFTAHKNIDFQKWDTCIRASQNGRAYAYSWYLDAVTQSRWDALIWGDYEAVFPLPFNRKLLGFKQVYQPFFAQQLGIFSIKEISNTLLLHFLDAIPTSYQRFYIQLNTCNPLETNNRFQVAPKPNYTLNLHTPYATIRQGYSKGLKYNIKQAQKANLQVNSLAVKDFIAFYEANPMQEGRRYNQQLVRTLSHLLPQVEQQQMGGAKGVFDTEGQLIAAAFILESHQQLIYLLARSTATGRAQKAMPFLLDELIQAHAEQQLILDFEGSGIPSVAKFFRSFGAKETIYYGLSEK